MRYTYRCIKTPQTWCECFLKSPRHGWFKKEILPLLIQWVTWVPHRSPLVRALIGGGCPSSVGLAAQGGQLSGLVVWELTAGAIPPVARGVIRVATVPSHRALLSCLTTPTPSKCGRMLKASPCFWWSSASSELQVPIVTSGRREVMWPQFSAPLFSPQFSGSQTPLPRQALSRLMLV